MERLDTKDGFAFIKGFQGLEEYVRKHEPEIANSQEQNRRYSQCSLTPARELTVTRARSSSTLAAALSLASFSFATADSKPTVVTLTPNQAFYLLSRFEELDVDVGPMNVRLENISSEQSSAYVSFLSRPRRYHGGERTLRSSTSSVHRAMAAMGNYLTSFGFSSKGQEKAKIEHDALTYLYSAFTKIPSLRLVSDSTIPLIHGYEEYPFDSAVPLYAFHNLHTLEVIDTDFRSFYGWDRLAERLTSLTLNNAGISDLDELLTGIVLDDLDRRRRRSAKSSGSSASKQPPSPTLRHHRLPAIKTMPNMTPMGSPDSPCLQTASPTSGYTLKKATTEFVTYAADCRDSSASPHRAGNGTKHTSTRRRRGSSYHKMKRSRSGSSQSSDFSRRGSIANLMINADGVLVPKWQRLSYLNLAGNSLYSVSTAALSPVADSLRSFDLSQNKFTEIPESLACLCHLRSLNMSYCEISDLRTLQQHRQPAHAITTLRLQGNSITSIEGIERLASLERLDLRNNCLEDPRDLACLTTLPRLREIWVQGNPFTKTHPNYRITIFNMFRRTSGFMHDLVIDNNEPRFHERKSLADRIGDLPNVTMSQSVASDSSSDLHMIAKLAFQPASGNDQHLLAEPTPTSHADDHPPPTVRRKPNFTNLHDQDRPVPEESHATTLHMLGDHAQSHSHCVQSPPVMAQITRPLITQPAIAAPLHHVAPNVAGLKSQVTTCESPMMVSSNSSVLSQMTLRCPEPTSPTSCYSSPSPVELSAASGPTSVPSTATATPSDSPATMPSFQHVQWTGDDSQHHALQKQLPSMVPEAHDDWAALLKRDEWVSHRDEFNMISMASPATPRVM
ncbi:hypothetical protein KEM52_006653 [Ascosphaera acerosa]|nr:hypothetical protein KEM52_006653 [Ascosphaera acerosa]